MNTVIAVYFLLACPGGDMGAAGGGPQCIEAPNRASAQFLVERIRAEEVIPGCRHTFVKVAPGNCPWSR